jgi:hypothetical protein
LDFEETIRATGMVPFTITLFTVTLFVTWLLAAVVTAFKPGNVGADVVRIPLDLADIAGWLFSTVTVTVSIVWLPAPSLQSIVIV